VLVINDEHSRIRIKEFSDDLEKISISSKMKAVDFSETSESINQSTQRSISEEFSLYRHHRENPEWYVFHHRQITQEVIWPCNKQ
jgi:hypothetical protein